MQKQTSSGYCECGCGQRTRIAEQNRHALGHVKGQPLRFINGHNKTSLSDEGRRKRAASKRGAGSPSWKGDAVSYRALHSWLNRYYPKTNICEFCGKVGRTDYALMHGQEHGRDRHKYHELCRGCHIRYDHEGIK